MKPYIHLSAKERCQSNLDEIFSIGVLKVKERIFNAILSDGGRSGVEKYDLLNNHLIHLYEFYFDKFDKPKTAIK